MRIRMRTVVPTLLLTLVFVAASTITPILAQSPNEDVVITSTSIVSPTGEVRTSVTPGICGPIDLTIALDDTGSMFGAIANIKAELPTIISTATIASGGDLMVGYMTFKDLVHVRNNLTTNISAVTDSINATVAGGGAGGPESSDEAKNTSVNNLPAGTRPDAAGNLGTQIGNYTTPYRAGATKIVVLITDAPPGGFNDIQNPADNTSLNTTHPLTALSKGIKVSDVFVPTGGDYAGQAALLEKDANTTGGAFITTAANGSGTGAAITKVIEACGGVTPGFTAKKDFRFTDVNFNATPAVLGNLLPDADADGKFDVRYVTKPKDGTVSSTNPGQLYGVITVNGTGVDMVNITDTFDMQFDVNPAKLGGGVEILRVNATTGLATVITNTAQVTSASVDNAGNMVTLNIDLDAPLGADEKLMVYIKFKTALKGLPPNMTDFMNDASLVINGGAPQAATATIEFV